MTNSVQQGQAPGGAMPFRGLAYLGAKASEQLNTARALWENAHKLRYEKCLVLAQKNWDTPRMAAVAGYNGRSSMTALMGSDLGGGFTLDFVPDSSRPIQLDEKFQALAMLLQGGLVDPTDPSTRDYVMDLANLEGLNLADHLQYAKAARDLDAMKQGKPPRPNQYMKFDVHLKFFANFIQTEEFEALDPGIAQGILAYTGMLNMQMQAINAPMMPGAGAPGPGQQAAQLAAAVKEHAGKAGAAGGTSPLSGVPGESNGPQSSEQAAGKQAAVLGSALP